MDILKKLYKLFKERLGPLREEDLKYRCRIFCYESYLGQYGCAIEYPDDNVIIWLTARQLEKHPNKYFSENYIIV